MKKLLLIVMVAVAATGCSGCKNKKGEPQVPVGETVITETRVVADEHNSRNSLEYWGTYRGVMPCADCEGIKVRLELGKDDTYELYMMYLGKDDKKELVAKGSFVWNESGSDITLKGFEGGPNHFRVGENFVRVLDIDGHIITGDFEDMYIFKKEVH